MGQPGYSSGSAYPTIDHTQLAYPDLSQTGSSQNMQSSSAGYQDPGRTGSGYQPYPPPPSAESNQAATQQGYGYPGYGQPPPPQPHGGSIAQPLGQPPGSAHVPQGLQGGHWTPPNGYSQDINPAAAGKQQAQGVVSGFKLGAPIYGPWLRFNNWSPQTCQWTGSVLVLLKRGDGSPRMRLTEPDSQTNTILGTYLDSQYDYDFWQFRFATCTGPYQKALTYQVVPGAGCSPTEPVSFFVPASQQRWHWGFHSCSGFSSYINQEDYGGVGALWHDVLKRHAISPLHAMVGGGDQIYNDGVFVGPVLKKWMEMRDRDEYEHHPFTPEMAAEATQYYFTNYCQHFSSDGMRQALACIPQVMTWDDHDIYDGYGSYPPRLQNCPVFVGLYEVARRFYILFQQHTVLSRAGADAGMFGAEGALSMVKQLGNTVALVIPDGRGERTRHQVPGSEEVLGLVSGLSSKSTISMLMAKTGISTKMMRFNEPELLDDLVDHWTSHHHSKERTMLIERMQSYSGQRGWRTTFLSGDVHCAALGKFYTKPKMKDARKDVRLMYQVISSAIVNAPPPDKATSLMQFFDHASTHVNKHTKEKMCRLFSKDYPKNDKVLPRRNWCEITEAPWLLSPTPVTGVRQEGELTFQLRVEDNHKRRDLPLREYDVVVPLYITDATPRDGAPNAAAYPGQQQQHASHQQHSGQYAQPPPGGHASPPQMGHAPPPGQQGLQGYPNGPSPPPYFHPGPPQPAYPADAGGARGSNVISQAQQYPAVASAGTADGTLYPNIGGLSLSHGG